MTTDDALVAASVDVAPDERARRMAKLDALRHRGVDPYPVGHRRDHAAAVLRERFGTLMPDAETGAAVRVAGRLMLIRHHGGLLFATLVDATGSIQLLASREALSAEAFSAVETLDRGDWVAATGTVMATHTGELTVAVSEVVLLAKALRPLPDKRYGLTDVDTRLRERYLDLIVNPQTRRTFAVRSTVVATVRQVLIERGFVEVETPVLDAHAGGAAARPFITHHNALDLGMYLRIALELPLKRLVVGGFDRVFEIGRVFRNEGLDPRHNPEFTLLEAYQALGDYHDMMELVEAIVARAAVAANGTTTIDVDGVAVDLAPPWRRVTMADLVLEHTGERMHPSMALEEARTICRRRDIDFEPSWGAGRLLSAVYEEACEPHLVAPTFVLDHPKEVSPLARTHRDDDLLTERFEVVVAGRELANAYSELNDPAEQRARFEAEAAARAAGDVEAGEVDEDYLRALEYGLPPTGGLGVGIDRLVMLIAGARTIREVILFPALRPQEGEAPQAAPASSDEATERPAPAHDDAPPAAPLALAPPPGRRAARALGTLTALAGAVLLLCAILDVPGRLGVGRVVHDLNGRVAGHVATIVVGLVLMLVAGPLRRGQRRAWMVAIGLFAAGAVGALARGPDTAAVIASAALLVALVWHRGSFVARSDPGSLLDVARIVPRLLGLTLAFATTTLLVEQDHVREHVTAGGILETTALGLAGVAGPYHYTDRFLSESLPGALHVLGLAGLALLCFVAFRAVRDGGATTLADHDRARAIVAASGHGTLDYFALRSDKSYFFSAAGDALIAYTYLNGQALVAGDPIGPPGARERVLAEFVTWCRLRGWRTAFLAALEDDLPLYRRLGLRSVYLGDEAVIRCTRFSLAGGAMKGVRSAVRRVERSCTFRMLPESDATPELRASLNALRDRWRGGEAERGFTMELGGGVTGQDPNLLLAIATDPDGRALGFLRLAPCAGPDPGWSLDLMQHDPGAPNGMTEFLVAKTAQALAARGCDRLSLNFAAWGRLFETGARLTAAQRVQRKVAEAFNPYFQITSLRDFNAKFDPEWVPRCIVVEDLEAIPRTALAYAAVEGFLRVPLIGSRLVPAVPAEATE